MDFVDLVRVLDPGAVSKSRGHLEEKSASRASQELSVELNLGTANTYACFDSFNTLIELVSTWTDQLVTEQKPRDTTALQPLGTVTEVGARGLDLSHTSGVRSDRRLVWHENDGEVNILEEIDADAFGIADDDPAYYCDSDSDSYCEKKFPGTACILFDNYGDVISKCTPNTAKRPACREENLSGGDDCW
ncbi:hypothetical protein PsorP6_002670 [Peronosclerospora sorghi]|uniref:Uncharacterized protein n=1 Tax=Peronosclerospora sorghi TaxID=230839 RepID=A0ACC0WSF1_9STRA|nr:hypothetical protein PsorP6_002670 [Peronosclerospora sorghi]